MSSYDPLKAIEELEQQNIKKRSCPSREELLGAKIMRLKEHFPFGMYKWWKKHQEFMKLQEKVSAISKTVRDEDFYYASPVPVDDKRGVVYTCITGGYDDPYEPILLNENLDYVLYTDRSQDDSDTTIWERKQLDGIKVEKQSNYANRYCKFHPFDLFSGYDYSIYIDGNVQTVSDVTGLYAIAKQAKTGIAMHRHFARNSAYKEALWCEYNHRGNVDAIHRQMERYAREGFPEQFGLCEATIIVVDLHNEIAKQLLDAWWEEFCTTGSGRDQLSFPYVIWKHGYGLEDVGCLGNDEYRNPKFRINVHKGKLF